MYRTDWFRFQVRVQDGQLLRLDPVNISAAALGPLSLQQWKADAPTCEGVVTGGAKTRTRS